MGSKVSLYPPTSGAYVEGTRLRAVKVPKEIHDSYVKLYNAAARLTHSMDTILDHEEHKRVLAMGEAKGLQMPVAQDFRAQNEKMKAILNDFSPYDINGLINNDKGRIVSVLIPFEAAVGFHYTALESARMIALALKSFYNRDYQTCFRVLKEEGNPYQGPISYDKVSKTWHVLLAACEAHEVHAPVHKLPANWLQCSPGMRRP